MKASVNFPVSAESKEQFDIKTEVSFLLWRWSVLIWKEEFWDFSAIKLETLWNYFYKKMNYCNVEWVEELLQTLFSV